MPMQKLPRLKLVRDRKGMTQRELADKAKVSPTTVIQLELGRVDARASTVRKLADALDVKPEELMGDE